MDRKNHKHAGGYEQQGPGAGQGSNRNASEPIQYVGQTIQPDGSDCTRRGYTCQEGGLKRFAKRSLTLNKAVDPSGNHEFVKPVQGDDPVIEDQVVEKLYESQWIHIKTTYHLAMTL